MAEVELELGACGIPEPVCLTAALNPLWSPCLLPLASPLPTTQPGVSTAVLLGAEKKDEVLFISFKETFLASKERVEKGIG